jgi:hypothetical protein
MPAPRRLFASILASAAVCTLAFAAPAAAKGGGGSGGGSGGGGGTSAPPPQPAADPCAPLVGKVYSDGTVADDYFFGIIGGCAVIRFHDDFSVTVYEVLPQPAWTYRLDVQNQTNGGRVSIDYTETATGRKTSLMEEPGKTVVKQ